MKMKMKNFIHITNSRVIRKVKTKNNNKIK